MTAYGVAAERRRPATLNIGSWLGVGVGLLSILGPVTMIVMGKDSIQAFYEKSLIDVLGDDAADLVGTDADLSNAYRALVVKAVIGLIVGAAILVLALVARGGSTPGRIGLAAALVVGLCGGSALQLVELDVLPSISVVIAGITPLLSLVAIVLLFLPASNQYAAARKTAVAAG